MKGAGKKTLRKVYVATQRSVLDYAGAAWQPYLSNTQFHKLETAQKFKKKNYPDDRKVLICTDSQSLCKAIKHSSPDTARILHLLDCSTRRIVIQWVPGHTAVAGNEIADEEAKSAADDTSTDPEPSSLGAALSCIKRTFKD